MLAKPPKSSNKMKSPKRRALVVVGMHRSGTSAMTGTLSLLGAQLPKQLMPANEYNAKGFWEALSVANLNDEILRALNSEWDDVFVSRGGAAFSNFGHDYLGRAVELLGDEFDGTEPIVLKDPRISVLTRFWDRALREAGYATNYVVMVRNPLEIAESLQRRDGFSREKSLLLWSSYMIAAERNTRDRQRVFVSYDQLIRDWRVVRASVEANMGMRLPRDTAAAGIEVDAYLDQRLRHHQAQEDIFSRADVSQEIKTLARVLFDAAAGAEIDHVELDALGYWLAELDMLVGPLLRDLRGEAENLAQQAASWNQAHASARQQADGLAEQLTLEGERVAAAYAERDRLAMEVEESVRQGEAFAARIGSIERERDLLASDARDKGEEIQSLIEQVEACRTNLATTRANVAELEQRIVGFDAGVERAVCVVERLVKHDIAEAQSERNQIAAELAAERLRARSAEENAQAERDRLVADLEQANAVTEQLSHAQASREAIAEEYKSQAAQMAERVAAANAERDRVAVEVEERIRQAEALAARIAAIERDRDLLASDALEKERNAQAERDRLVAELGQANATLHRFRTSVSWRVTRPLRWTGRALRLLR